MQITSPDFSQGEPIPPACGCKGGNRAPALHWKDVPEATQSLAVVCDDPDAPSGTYLHWLVVNIPPQTSGIPAGGILPSGAVAMTNSSGRKAYSGPCPPSGTHHYHFKLYALDVPALYSVSRTNYDKELEKHALAKADLMGTYSH